MKLHLPTRLRAAVLACFAVVTSFATTLATGAFTGGIFAVTAATVSTLALSQPARALSAASYIALDTTADYTGTGVTYTAETGVLSGSGLSADLIFDLKYGDLQANQRFIYVTRDGTTTKWGIGTNADGNVCGWWGDEVWSAAANVACPIETIAALAEEGAETVLLTADITGSGTALASGATAAMGVTGNLFNATDLKSTGGTITNTTIDKSVVTRLYLADASGTYTRYTSGDFAVMFAADTHVNATAERVTLEGGESGNAAGISATRNPIFVGGAGQLFLQAWGTGAISLDNDIYLAASTHADAETYGVIRFGNDGGADNTITLNGTVTILDNTFIKTNGGDPVYINGEITDKKLINGGTAAGGKTLTIGGSGYVMSGRVDVSNISLVTGAGVSLAGESIVENLTTAADSTLTVAEGGSLTLGGTLNLQSAIVNNGSLAFDSDVRLDLSQKTATDGVYTFFTGNNSDSFAALTIDNLTGVLIDGYDIKYDWTFNADGTLTFVPSDSCIYAGGTLTWDTTSASFEGETVFANGGSVLFEGDSHVTLAENINASDVRVNTGVEVFLKGNSSRLTVSQLDLQGTLILEDDVLHADSRVQGNGTLKVGDNMTFNSALLSAFTGNLVVQSGATLTCSASDALGVNYLTAAERTVTVESGGVLDVKGCEEYYSIVLQGGASLSNTGSAISTTNFRQTPKITLLGNATIHAGNEFGIVASSHGDSSLILNDHTITKTGAGSWVLSNTTVGAGTIRIQEGSVSLKNDGAYTGTVFEVGAGTTFATTGGRLTKSVIYLNSQNSYVSSNTTLGAEVVVAGDATFEAQSGTYTNTRIILKDGGTFNYRTGGNHTFAALNTGDSVADIVEGREMTVSEKSVSTGLLTKSGAGKLIYGGAVALREGVNVQAGTVTFNGAATISGLLTVAEGATLNVGTDGSVVLGNLDGFTADSAAPTSNGIVTTTELTILNNGGTSNISSVMYNGTSHSLTSAGKVSLPDIYYVVSDTVTVGGTTPTANVDGATGFVVKSGATLNVAGNVSDAMTVNKVLTTTSGNGTMRLTTNALLKDGATCVFTGNLEIASGVKLSLGSDVEGSMTNAQTAFIDSFASTVLDGGTLFVRGVHGNLGTITVKENSTGSVLQLHDMTGTDGFADGSVFVESMQLDAALTMKCNWKNNIDISSISGSGNLTLLRGNGDTVNLRVGSLTGYTGSLQLGESGKTTNIRIATGSTAVNMGGLSVTDSLLNLDVQAATSLTNGLTLNAGTDASVAITAGASLSGAVNVTGTGNSLTSTAGGMNLSQLNVAENAALDLNGSVSALLMNQAGTVDIANMLLTDGAVLTYGNAANLLNVTDGMLVGNVVIGAGLTLTEAGVNLGLSSAIDQSKIGISNYADSALQVVGDTWHLKSVAVDPNAAVRYYWESASNTYWVSGKWSLTDNDTTNLVSLPSDMSRVILVYSGAGTEESPNIMRLNNPKNVYGVEVVDGYYRLRTETGSGKITCAGDLVTGNNGHLIMDLNMVAANLQMAADSSIAINSTLELNEGGDVVVTGAGAAILLGNGRNLTADALDLSAAGATLSVSGAGNANSANTATLSSINLGEGSGLTLKAGTSNLTVAASALSLGTGATISVEAGQVLDLTGFDYSNTSGSFNANGHFEKLVESTSGAGTVKLKTAIDAVCLTRNVTLVTNLEMGNARFNSYGWNAKLTIGENGSISSSDAANNYLRLENRMQLEVAGGSLSVGTVQLGHSTAGYAASLTLTSGGISTSGIVYTNSNDTGSTFTMSGGTLDITATTGISTGITTTITGGTLKASGADGWGVTGASIGGAEVSADSAGKVTMTNTTVTDDITGNDKLVLSGTANVTANATVSGASVGGIKVTTTDDNKLTLEDTTIGSVITNNGSLELTGTQNVMMEDTSVTTYSDGKNGYKNTSSVYTLVNGTGQTGVSGVSWQVNGTSIVESDFTDISFTNGVLTIQEGDSAGKVYYINSDTVEYTTDATCAEAEKLQLNGGTLVLNNNLNTAVTMGGITVMGSSTALELHAELAADNLSLNADASTVLVGDGTLNLGTGTALASGITLGSETDAAWTGKVKVSGAELADADLSSLGISGSTIELAGASGSLKGGTYAAAVLLSNDTELTLGADNDFEGGLNAVAGSLNITGRNSISTLTMADGATLGFDFTGMGLDSLKDIGTDALLTVGELKTATGGGSLNLSALVSEELLLTMAHGQSITLADIASTGATLGLGIEKVTESPVTEVELVDANGFTYMYVLTQDNLTGKVVVKLSARLRQNGWIGDENDTWKNTDTVGMFDSNWDDSTGLFLGYGSGTVNIDTEGVDVSGKTVLVSASEGTTDYTFLGGALVADRLSVNAGSLTISNEGVDILRTVQVSDTARLTVSGGSELSVGTDMAVLDKAFFTNRGTTTVSGTLSVANNATVTNNRTLTVGRISAEEGAIHSIGRLIIGNGGGVLGTLTGNGYLDNSGNLTIKNDVALEAITNTGELTVDGTLKAVTISGKGTLNAGAAELGNATVAGLYVTGAVKADNLTADNAAMDSLVADKLVSLAGGTVEVRKDATLKTLMVNGCLTVGGKLTATETVNTEGEVTAAEAELTTATFDTLKVTGSVAADNLSVKQLETAALSASTLTVDGGVASIGSSVTLDSFTGLGKAQTRIQGDFTVNSTVVKGGSIEADKITVKGNAAFTDVKADSLTADAVALTTGSISQLNTNVLTVNKGGLVSVENAVKLNSLGGEGTLQVSNKLTLAEQITCSANVEAQEVELLAVGNSLGSVLADTLTLAGGVTLSTTDAVLKTTSFGALSNSGVSVVMSDTVVDSLLREESGRFSTVDYLIIDGVGAASSFNLVDGGEWQALQLAGMNAALTVNKGGLYLSITAVTDENGEELKLTWDATDGNNTTSLESDIHTGAGFYKALDYVQEVILADERIFDLSADEVGDATRGNASDPQAGLLVRNLSGGGELTIKGNGAGQDVASIFNTDGRVTAADDAVALTVDASTVNLGLPQESTGKLVEDYSSTGPTLASLALINGARVEVQTDTEILGDTDLADGTRLTVKEGSLLTTGMLSGTEDTIVSGAIRVSKGGVYTGSYEAADITAAGESRLRLRLAGRSGLGLAAESGSNVNLDYASQGGSMDFLRVGEVTAMARMARMAASATTELNLLNTTVTDSGIVHNTLSLAEQEGNHICKAAVTLSLGVAETARTLGTEDVPVVIDGAVDVTDSAITVNMLGSAAADGVLNISADALTELTLAQLVTDGRVEGNTVVLTGTPEVEALMAKYYSNARLNGNGAIVVDRTTDYYSSRLSLSGNGSAGVALADAVLVKLNPQADREEYRDMAAVLDSLDAAVIAGNSASADRLGAAVSGASVAAMGAAVAGDLERQLLAIRNRTTTMGVDQSKPNLDMPYFNAWINAEGDFRRMDEDGTAAGYELNSWGGTVGFDADVSPNLTMGLAATAMYGDFTAKSAEHAEGDLDTYYVTGFARYAAHRWSHTFVATLGMAEASLKRTVTHARGSYSAEGDTDALSFGFLYEAGYVAAMNESATACLQPVFNVMLTHSALSGYDEEGSDAALTMGDVDMTTVTFGLGARVQAQVGTSLYNHSSILEGRALLKLRAGDREAEAENALRALPGVTGSVTGAEMGVVGVELGVGLTVPVGSESGSVFADASLEVGGGYTNINGTVGYRINF